MKNKRVVFVFDAGHMSDERSICLRQAIVSVGPKDYLGTEYLMNVLPCQPPPLLHGRVCWED